MTKIEELRKQLLILTNPAERKIVIMAIQKEHNRSVVERGNKQAFIENEVRKTRKKELVQFNQKVIKSIVEFIDEEYYKRQALILKEII